MFVSNVYKNHFSIEKEWKSSYKYRKRLRFGYFQPFSNYTKKHDKIYKKRYHNIHDISLLYHHIIYSSFKIIHLFLCSCWCLTENSSHLCICTLDQSQAPYSKQTSC